MSAVATEQTWYSSTDVCELVGCSFRMLDYWIRNGHITITHDAHGSGNHRRISADELRRIKILYAEITEAKAILEMFESGELWRQIT